MIYKKYKAAKERAEKMGLQLAEYGCIYGTNTTFYAVWNKSGDRLAPAEVYAEYKFDKNGNAI